MKKSDFENVLNRTTSENGAVMLQTSGSKLLDLNFSVSSARNWSTDKIYEKFIDAYKENSILAIKWLFFVRDCRGGMGERRFFRSVIKKFAETHSHELLNLIGLIPEYGRFDDLLCLLDTSLKYEVMNYIKNTLEDDERKCKQGESISLLAKWLPSINASSKETKRYASIIIEYLYPHTRVKRIKNRLYSKRLSSLRSYLKIVEKNMSSYKWSEIDYEQVPSKANLIYSDAFLRNDFERRSKYLHELKNGNKKINSSVLFPHDIVHKYTSNYCFNHKIEENYTYESLWSSLPDFVSGENSTIVVADGSASMRLRIGKTNISSLEVANALAIYFSERCSGEFKDAYITFSNKPKMVDLSMCKSLSEKIEKALTYNECSNTNVEAVFDLILQIAIKNNYSQDEIPKNILILSDMEFDSCAIDNSYGDGYRFDYKIKENLFQNISKKYQENGYELPKLIFWNLCSRTNPIPVSQNKNGVILVSGFSPSVMDMALSGNLDPYEALVNKLNSERYKPIEEALS